MTQNIQVFKFGGVAVGSADAVRVAMTHIRDAKSPVVAVVSAMNGVTDLLLNCARAALKGDRDACRNAAIEFEERHANLVSELSPRGRTNELLDVVGNATAEMLSIAESISVLRELTPRAQDAMVSRGERVLARIFSTCIDADYVDATDVIFAERRAGTLWPSFMKCERAAKKEILPRLAAGGIVIIPG